MPMVSYDLNEVPEVPQEEREKVAALSDDDIDYSDIPEISDFSGFVRARDKGPAKRQSRVEIDLDNDVIAWIGDDYQSRINTILREVMHLAKLSSPSL
jgi:uncharacterized protein (DUF4415 family)